MGISCIWENDEYENIENYRVQALIKYLEKLGLIYKSV